MFAPALTGKGAGARRMQIGLTGLNYFSGVWPFLNWWLTASPPTVYLSAGGQVTGRACWTTSGGANYFDALGELVNPVDPAIGSFSRIIYQGNSEQQAIVNSVGWQWGAAGCLTMDWQGSATGGIGNLGTGGGIDSGNGTTGPITFHIGNGADASPAPRLFPTNANDPPRNIRIYPTKYAANINRGEIFNPDWIAQIGKFGCIRFMDWGQTNQSIVTDYAHISPIGSQYQGAVYLPGTSSDNGPTGSASLGYMTALLNTTGSEGHYCIPVEATDACVTNIAQFFRDNTNNTISYELGNECSWPSVNSIGTAYLAAQALLVPGNPWSGDGTNTRAAKFYGYRHAQMMKIIRDTYNARGRWRGSIGTQSVNTIVTNNIMTGVSYYLTNVLSNSLVVSDLFNDIMLTSYMLNINSTEVQGKELTAITQSATPTATVLSAHGFTNGQRIKFFIGTATFTGAGSGTNLTVTNWQSGRIAPGSTIAGTGISANTTIVSQTSGTTGQNGVYVTSQATTASGTCTACTMSQLHNVTVTVLTTPTSTTFTFDVDTSSFTAFAANSSQQVCMPALLFDIMDTSLALSISSPATYPDKYKYFNDTLRDSCINGSANGYVSDTSYTIPGQSNVSTGSWKTQKDIATTNGLVVRQYEGGPNFQFGLYLVGGGANLSPQANEYWLQWSYSKQCGDMMTATYQAFATFGDRSAQFTEGSPLTTRNPWMGTRNLPGDAENPRWQAVISWNRGP